MGGGGEGGRVFQISGPGYWFSRAARLPDPEVWTVLTEENLKRIFLTIYTFHSLSVTIKRGHCNAVLYVFEQRTTKLGYIFLFKYLEIGEIVVFGCTQ